MIEPSRPANDALRVDALRSLQILDTPGEERYDRLTRQLSEALGVPIAYLALVDKDRQWLKSEVGGMPCEIGRNASFCGHAILDKKPLVVADARKDPRFARNPMVTGEPFLRFYAGFPLATPDGLRFGTLCVADTVPRQLSPGELDVVARAARLIEGLINAKPHVFISYSHQDEPWKDRLLGHLNVLQSQDLLTLWEDRRIDAGDAWRREIQEAIEAANVAILLVSAGLLSSRFVLDVEVPSLLQRRDQEGLRIAPLLIKPCCWDCVPWLEQLNVFPRNAEPLSSKAKHEIDGELASFSSQVLELARTPPSAPSGRGPLVVPTEPIVLPTEVQRHDDGVGQSTTLEVRPATRDAVRLTVRDKEAPGTEPEVVRFRQDRIVLGRHRHCDVVLRDRQRRVSGRHAEIVVADDGFAVTDLMSTNFTFLGDEQLEPDRFYPLTTGDRIEIGAFEIAVEILRRRKPTPTTAEVTHLDLSFVNLFEEPVRQLGDLLRKLAVTHEAMPAGRREVALHQALTDCLGDQSDNPVLMTLGRFLDPR